MYRFFRNRFLLWVFLPVLALADTPTSERHRIGDWDLRTRTTIHFVQGTFSTNDLERQAVWLLAPLQRAVVWTNAQRFRQLFHPEADYDPAAAALYRGIRAGGQMQVWCVGTHRETGAEIVAFSLLHDAIPGSSRHTNTHLLIKDGVRYRYVWPNTRNEPLRAIRKLAQDQRQKLAETRRAASRLHLNVARRSNAMNLEHFQRSQQLRREEGDVSLALAIDNRLTQFTLTTCFMGLPFRHAPPDAVWHATFELRPKLLRVPIGDKPLGQTSPLGSLHDFAHALKHDQTEHLGSLFSETRDLRYLKNQTRIKRNGVRLAPTLQDLLVFAYVPLRVQDRHFVGILYSVVSSNDTTDRLRLENGNYTAIYDFAILENIDGAWRFTEALDDAAFGSFLRMGYTSKRIIYMGARRPRVLAYLQEHELHPELEAWLAADWQELRDNLEPAENLALDMAPTPWTPELRWRLWQLELQH